METGRLMIVVVVVKAAKLRVIKVESESEKKNCTRCRAKVDLHAIHD